MKNVLIFDALKTSKKVNRIYSFWGIHLPFVDAPGLKIRVWILINFLNFLKNILKIRDILILAERK